MFNDYCKLNIRLMLKRDIMINDSQNDNNDSSSAQAIDILPYKGVTFLILELNALPAYC